MHGDTDIGEDRCGTHRGDRDPSPPVAVGERVADRVERVVQLLVHDLEVGDHVILVARVEDGGALPENEPPLMYYRRSWGVWSPVHEPSEPEPVEIAAMEVSGRDLRWQGAEF